MTVGQRLRNLRGDRTIVEVSKEIGITPSALCNYEKDYRVPKDDVKKKIANYYKRSVGSIFFRKEYTKRINKNC